MDIHETTIWYVIHSILPRLSGLGFCWKSFHTKPKKAQKNGRALFLSVWKDGLNFDLLFILSSFFFLTICANFPFQLFHHRSMITHWFRLLGKHLWPNFPPNAERGQYNNFDVPYHWQPLFQPLCLSRFIHNRALSNPTNTPPRPTLETMFQSFTVSGINNVFYYLLLWFTSYFIIISQSHQPPFSYFHGCR